MSAALAAGSRRRALTQLATPAPALGVKRPLKKSPLSTASTASPAATVTPDPKRLMVSSSEKTESGSAGSGCQDKPPDGPVVSPTELFPPNNGDMPMASPGLVVYFPQHY